MSAFTKTKSIPKAQLGMKLDSIINDKSRYLCLNFQVRTMLYNIGLSVLFSCYEPIPNRHVCTYLSCSAHGTTNFTNSEFQHPLFKVLQSVFIFLCVNTYTGIF